MYKEPGEEHVSVRAFVSLLSDGLGQGAGQEPLSYGKRKGWLNSQDMLEQDAPLFRRSMARILHDFLRVECGEQDEADWGIATRMQDLYDCRTCVNHVAQMVAKGILEPKRVVADGRLVEIFGMTMPVTRQEALEGITKAFYKELRVTPAGKEKEKENRINCVPAEQFPEYRKAHPHLVCVDVRTRDSYEKEHVPGAISVPLAEILQNGRLDVGQEQEIFLYCELGYQSRIAANCLLENGYKKLSYGLVQFQKEDEDDT